MSDRWFWPIVATLCLALGSWFLAALVFTGASETDCDDQRTSILGDTWFCNALVQDGTRLLFYVTPAVFVLVVICAIAAYVSSKP